MISGKKVKLRDKRLEDAQDDYNWSKDPELASLDATPPLSISYSDFLAGYASELRYPSLSKHRFAIDTLGGKHIGNCSYYNVAFTKNEAELGIMIGDRDYWDKGYGTDVVNSVVNYIFRRTKLKRLYLKTLDRNIRAQKCFQRCGFTPYADMAKDGLSFVLMEIRRDWWEREQKEQETHEGSALPA